MTSDPQELGLEARDMYARILCKRFKQGQGELVYAASPSLVGKRGTAARHALGRKQAMKEEAPRTPCTCLARAAPLKKLVLSGCVNLDLTEAFQGSFGDVGWPA